MTAKMKPSKKMDPYTVSAQRWEIQYVADKFNVSCEIVRTLRKANGRSRRKLYAELRRLTA